MMNNNMNFEVVQGSLCDISFSKFLLSLVQYVELELNCFLKKKKQYKFFIYC